MKTGFDLPSSERGKRPGDLMRRRLGFLSLRLHELSSQHEGHSPNHTRCHLITALWKQLLV
jgi:hypothetical protein